MVASDLDQIIRYSVQNPPPGEGNQHAMYFVSSWSGDALPQYGSHALDVEMRRLAREMRGSLFMGARHSLATQVAATPWTIRGSNRVGRSQEILQQADWGNGWTVFIEKLVKDFTTFNAGAFVEIIGAGKLDKPLVGRPLGVKVLDPLRSYLTGDPEWPVIYENYWTDSTGRRLATYHRMHQSRIHRLVDMADSDERLVGYGESGFYRYIAHHLRQIQMSRYQSEKLADIPPAGFMLVNNIPPGALDDTSEQYESDRKQEGQTAWRNVVTLQGVDPENPISVEFVPFAQLPDGFDYEQYHMIDVRMVALSLGIDPQDIWPLEGGMAGTAGQSVVLTEKARGSTRGLLYGEIERLINTKVVPSNQEFRFEPEDYLKDKEEAQRARWWMETVTTLDNPLTMEQRMQVLANTVPQIRDVVTDEEGNIILPDTDIRPEAESEVVPEVDETAILDGTATPGTEDGAITDGTESVKAYVDTRAEFVARMEDAFKAALDGSMTRSRAGVVIRGHLARSGRLAILDGLSDGGVAVEVLEGDDLNTYNQWFAEQSGYVGDLLDSIYQNGAAFDAGRRAQMWAQVSLGDVYRKGLLSADRNGMYEWQRGATKESCRTCLAADGQIHRLRDWEASGIMPQAHVLECHGFECKCALRRKPKGTRAKGKLSRIPKG